MQTFDVLAQRARVTPERLALEDIDSGRRYTYGELNERAARFARAARRVWGLQPGERIAYLGYNRAEFFAMLYGCAKAGLILVPLNWRLAEPELQALMADCEASALVHGAEFAETAHALQGARDGLQLIGLDTGAGRDYDADLQSVEPDFAARPDANPDTPWYLLYTAGTTGRSKGVIQTFRMMLANYLNIGLAVGLTGDDVLLNVLPVFHTAGINLYSSAVFLVGGTVLIARGFDPEQALDTLENRASVFFGVPAVYQALLEQPGFSGERLRGVRSWGCGGAALSLPVAQRFAEAGIRVRTGMGMTETGPTVFLLDEDNVLERLGSVGRPQLLAETRIVDADERDVPPGEAGELLIRGPGVTPGYWQQPEATRATFTADGWLRSGDIARCDAQGYYTIVDRRKDMFISGGENVYPAEIERVLEHHPAIAEVAVVGITHERWGEVGKAWLVSRPDRDPAETDALRDFCRRHLASYKVPAVFEWIDALPRNAVGKITKQALRDAG
ncbi:AMP-binding protein [Salinisphaera orenii]|uniref:AMP-dependent synthetase n=1 Tax=Salinisphaera orenii YIM 95161 TaxID=1051139 RepID=A0A423PHR6_9GAMM|nr:AMP-binding protein [Salinisphaera halophila]ROO25179.1 AMP-dependent synthetase [Salinisphaera halophila YIM 95161]